MIDKKMFAPLLKTLDRVVLGIEEIDEEKEEKILEFIEIDTEEEHDVERSMN